MKNDGFPSPRRVPATPLALLLAGACATPGVRTPLATDVPRLEAALRADSATSTRLQLAAAYREAGESARAIGLLEPLAAVQPADPVVALFLGLSYEDVGRIEESRRLYEACLEASLPAALRSRIERRLEALGPLELRAAARAAVAGEQAAAMRAPMPRTVGVFPFLIAARDTTLRPLGRALAELLSTDLAQTDRLRVLERVQVQALVDEIRLAQSGLVDAATAARAGRMLSAAHIVQGRVAGATDALSVEALVVQTTTPRDSAGSALRQQGALARVLDLEKEIALAIYSRLGIQLTVAERARVNQRPTENVQALLAFGYGLEAQDAGRYVEATAQFRRAAQLDPGFGRARELQARMEGFAAAGVTRDVARLATSQFDLRLSPWQRQRLTPDGLEALLPPLLVRDVTVELLGTEGLERSGLEIIIRRPGGSLDP